MSDSEVKDLQQNNWILVTEGLFLGLKATNTSLEWMLILSWFQKYLYVWVFDSEIEELQQKTEL